MVVQYLVGGKLVQVGQQAQPVVGLDVVEAVGEDLQERVEGSPGLLDEHLRQELVEESFDPERLDLRVDEEPAVGLHCAGGEGGGVLVGHLRSEHSTE